MSRRSVRERALALMSGGALAALVLALAADPAWAVATRSFELDDAAALSAGELSRTAVRSDGRVTLGVDLRRIALPDDVGLVYSAVRAADGAIYLGTGEQGRIYRLRGDAIELFAETAQLLVSAMAIADGTLYAGTLPEGRIYAIELATGTLRELVRPDATEHVWSLVWDARRRTLFAATGPEGRVLSIDAQGQVDIYWDSAATHVMSLALAPDGALYAGTSDDAIVVRITAPGRAEVVWDFPGNEITALALANGTLAVGANEFPDPPAAASGSTKRSATGARPARPRAGHGRVWLVTADGRAERVWAQEEGHVTALQMAADGTVYAALGADGRIARIEPDRTSAMWIDVDERQVLAMDLLGSEPFLATGDGAAVYRVLGERPRDAAWVSRVLDAEFAARWGQLVWRGSGSLSFQTRSGNTERPDETWSEWSSPMTTPGPIRSAGARFLQIRASWSSDPDAELRAVIAYYLPQNQRPVVSGVGLKARTPTKRAGTETIDRDAPPTPTPLVSLTWHLENPDSDRVRFRLRYREESQSVWREMLRDTEILSATEYQWNTSAIPDGFYVVSVEASDELSNPEGLALTHQDASEPILVDNHAPEVRGLAASGTRVTGTAEDAIGPIFRLEFAIDGGEWTMLFPEDDLLDTRSERFALDVSSLAAGSHVIAVRAFDAAGNVGAAETTVIGTRAAETGTTTARGRRRTP